MTRKEGRNPREQKEYLECVSFFIECCEEVEEEGLRQAERALLNI